MDQPLERKSFSHKVIFVGLALSLIAGLGAGIYILTHFATYEPKALRRVPEDARFVARLNVQQAVVHSPLVRYVLPLFERGNAGPEPRAKHLERKTTLELNVDVRELIFAELAPSRWLLLAGGFLRQDEVLAGVGRMLDDQGSKYTVSDGVLVRPSGVAFCVAENGTLILARRADDARRACGTPGDFPSWAVALSGPGVALAVYAADRGSWASSRGDASPGASARLRGGVFVVEADSHFPEHAQVLLKGEGWTATQITQLLSSKSKDFRYLLPLGPLKEVREEGPQFRVQGNLTREEFDDSVARMAARIEAALVEAGEPGEKG